MGVSLAPPVGSHFSHFEKLFIKLVMRLVFRLALS